MADPQVILPQSTEDMIMKICRDKHQDPPDSWARRRLVTVGEGVAAEVLERIYNQKTPIKNLNGLIAWFIDNPQSPIRVSAQQSCQSPDGHPESPSLPQSTEDMIMKICRDKHQDPPDSWARRRLVTVGEGVAAEVLERIYNQKTPIKNLNGLIVWFIDNPQSPIRVSAQQSCQSPDGHPESPSLPQSTEDMIMKICRDKHQDPPDSWARRRLVAVGEGVAAEVLERIYNQKTPIKNLNGLIVWFIDNPKSPIRVSAQQSCQSPDAHLQSPSNSPSPLKRASPSSVASPSFSDHAHGSAASPQNGGSSSFQKSGHPCTETASPNNVSRQLSFSGEIEIREKTGHPSISHQLTVFSQLEFRKLFLILSYIGREKLEDVISPRAADDIVGRKDLPMGDFEAQIWKTYGQNFCDKLDGRREYTDWESGKTHFYHCHVYGDGSYSFKGPILNTTKTHLQRELGDENVLIVKFVGKGKHSVLKVAREGILVGLRRYRFFVFKDESKDEKKKDRKEKDKSSTFAAVKCYFVRFDSLAPCDGSESYILSSRRIYEARCLFMHVHMVSSMAKYMARFSLILSKTIKLPVDLSTVQVERIEDIPCHDERGCIIHGEDGEPLILTDGTGFISEDLALKCPQDIGRARFIRDRDFQKFRDYIESGTASLEQREAEVRNKEAPLLMQCRLFKDGYAVKGTLLVNRKLPPGTIQIRPSMLKVERDDLCPVTETFNSLEIVAVSNKPRRTYLSKYLIALLNYGGVPGSFFLDLLMSALQETQMVYSNTRAALKVAIINGEVDDDSTAARMISSGIPLSEPNLQDRLSKLVNVVRTQLKEGKLPISESFYLMGTADPTPTGVLKSNEVCVILDNGQISGKVLVYRNPGLHFGDIHILEAVYVKELEDIVGNAKYGIFFSTEGQRSAAAEIANGDFDGDFYWVSRNPQLLEYFRASEPWTRVYSTPQAVNRKPAEFSAEELENELFRLLLQTGESSKSMGMAANSWLVFMDRLLTLGDDCAKEKDELKNKMLKLIDIYYDALDAPKSGKKINVPSDLMAERYPHYLQRDSNCSYNSTSILGQIYDKLQEFQSEVRSVGEIRKLPAFEVEVPERCLCKWSELYDEYRQDMTQALSKRNDSKNDAANEVIKKYKQLLYEAEDFQESKKDVDEIYNEALAIYHVTYDFAIRQREVAKCGFAWKVAGSALCNLHAFRKKENPIRILPSLLRDILM